MAEAGERPTGAVAGVAKSVVVLKFCTEVKEKSTHSVTAVVVA